MSNDKDQRPSPQPSPIGEGEGLAAIASIATIAAAADPERCMVRKCVGCTTFDDNPAECGRCYAELYGRTTPSPRRQEHAASSTLPRFAALTGEG